MQGWAADGNTLLVVSDRTGRAELFVTRRAGRDYPWAPLRQLSTMGASMGSWSPDGARIAFGSGSSLWVMTVEGTQHQVLVRSEDLPGHPRLDGVRWRSGENIYLRTGTASGVSSFWAVSALNGSTRFIGKCIAPESQPQRASFKVDEERLYYVVADREGDIWLLDLEQGSAAN